MPGCADRLVHKGYRCARHGRIDFRVIVVGGVAYCARDDCDRRAVNLSGERGPWIVERALTDRGRSLLVKCPRLYR